jgi:signal transduction histidine kinase
MSTTVVRDFISALLAAVRDGVVAHDAAGQVMEVNARFCQMSGYARDELIGRAPPLPFWTGGAVPRAGQGRAILVHRDGRRLPVVVTTTPIGNGGAGAGSGNVVVVVGDDADRDRFEQQSSESEELSRAVLSSHPAQIAVLDADGTIIAVNDAWTAFARANGGTDTTGGVGTNYLDVCRAATGPCCDEAPAAADGIRAVLRRQQPSFEIEYPCHSPTQQRWFLLTAAPLRNSGGGAGGGGGGAIISHLDITARKQQEQDLLHHAQELAGLAEQLARSNRELDQFAYVTSHDLRAPLRGIANLASWIEEDLGPQVVTDEARKMLALLRGRVARMEGLIDGILEYSRIGRSKQKVEEVDVRKLLVETVDLLAPPPGAAVEIGPGMPTLLTGRLQLQQVFMNLIGNALKHAGRPDPKVTVTVADAGPGRLEFAVADNGQGIDPQYHEKIFVIFQTLAARDKVEGAGVGLSLVKKIVESQGGRVGVESKPGVGATFRFTWPREIKLPPPLPRAAAPAASAAPSAQPAPPARV